MDTIKYESLLQEMENLSLQYALNKASRRSLTARLKQIPDEIAALVVSKVLRDEKNKAFNKGIAAGIALLPVGYLIYKLFTLFSGFNSYWG